jgi:hypothetical protein
VSLVEGGGGSDFFILVFLNHYFINESSEIFFLNLSLLIHVSSPDVTQRVGACPGRHADRDRGTSYQSHQLNRRDWCLSRTSLFDVTQFPKYLTSLLSFFLFPFFLSTFSLQLTVATLTILIFPIKSYPVVL